MAKFDSDEPEAVERWYHRVWEAHGDDVLAYFLRRCRPDQAEDLLHEVFLTAWRRHLVAPAGDELRPWLFRIARNVLRNHRRAEERRRRLADRIRRAPPPAGAEQHGDPDASARLRSGARPAAGARP